MSLDTVALQSSPYERSMPKNMPNNYSLLQIALRAFVGKFGTFVAKIDSGLQKKTGARRPQILVTKWCGLIKARQRFLLA
jgi:hypothetical protein